MVDKIIVSEGKMRPLLPPRNPCKCICNVKNPVSITVPPYMVGRVVHTIRNK